MPFAPPETSEMMQRFLDTPFDLGDGVKPAVFAFSTIVDLLRSPEFLAACGEGSGKRLQTPEGREKTIGAYRAVQEAAIRVANDEPLQHADLQTIRTIPMLIDTAIVYMQDADRHLAAQAEPDTATQRKVQQMGRHLAQLQELYDGIFYGPAAGNSGLITP